MALAAPKSSSSGVETLRISQIVAALKGRNYDQQELGDFDGIRQGGAFNEPVGNPGATSVTFRHDSPDWGSKAIRVPHGVIPSESFWRRMEEISSKVEMHNSNGILPSVVDFKVHRESIWPESKKINAITMPWIEGRTVHSCARDLASRGDVSSLAALADSLEEFGKNIQSSPFDHGDISGGNIMIDEDGVLQLIDPDTLRHDDVSEGRIGEMGHPGYTHKSRSGKIWEDDLFRFPLEVMIVGVRGLAHDVSLADRFGDEDGIILFEESDLSDPRASELFDELCSIGDENLSVISRNLRDAALAESIPDANKILGRFRSAQPLPVRSNAVIVSPLSSYESPRVRRNHNSRPTMAPLTIPSFMRKEESLQ